jgi:hypothetical protein
MKRGRMQCKDIPDEPVLRFVGSHQGKWCTWGESFHMPSVQDAMPSGTPGKLQLAKMRMLMERGLVDGCGCGCRGDFVLTAMGRAAIGLERDRMGLEPN